VGASSDPTVAARGDEGSNTREPSLEFGAFRKTACNWLHGTEALAAVIPLAIPFVGKSPIEKVKVVPHSVERIKTMVKFFVPATSVSSHLDIKR